MHCAVLYFAFFLLMPVWTTFEKTKPVPDRVTTTGGMGVFGSLGVLILILALAIIPLKAVAAESAYDCGQIPCAELDLDLSDTDSLQRGSALFVNYCMGCHGLQFQRYQKKK